MDPIEAESTSSKAVVLDSIEAEEDAYFSTTFEIERSSPATAALDGRAWRGALRLPIVAAA
jgi:hypothetical protein